MKIPLKPNNETSRLLELNNLNILDTQEEFSFDIITKKAAEVCNTKISLISIVDEDRQWFKSHFGLEARETPRDYAFCAHAILTPSKPFIVENAANDDRFNDNPLVTDTPNVIFYTGIPLISKNGFPLGTLCVIDDKPSQISTNQLDQLIQLSKHTIDLIEKNRSFPNTELPNDSLFSLPELQTFEDETKNNILFQKSSLPYHFKMIFFSTKYIFDNNIDNLNFIEDLYQYCIKTGIDPLFTSQLVRYIVFNMHSKDINQIYNGIQFTVQPTLKFKN